MPFSTTTAAYDAIMKHFNDAWLIAYPTNTPFVAWPDVKQDTPPDNGQWVRIQFVYKNSLQATINSPGNRRFRQYGTLNVEIRTPLGDGLTKAQALTDTVLAIFEGQTTGPDAVIFREVSPVGPAEPDGVWSLTKITVRFEYDRIR